MDKCPDNVYSEGKREYEMPEYDPRVDLFKAIRAKFNPENPGYVIGRLIAGSVVKDEIWLLPMGHFNEEEPFVFSAYVPEEMIWSLLSHSIEVENWDEYVNKYPFKIFKDYNIYEVTPENLEKAFEGMDFTKKKPENIEIVIGFERKEPTLWGRIQNFFRNL